MGAGGLAMAIGDFLGDLGDEGAAEGAFRGGTVFAYTQGSGPILAFGNGRIPEGEVQRSWGSEWKTAAVKWIDRYCQFLSTEHCLAYRQNYMDLDPTYKDKWGDPLLRMTLDWTDADRKQAAFVRKKEVLIAKAMGATGISPRDNNTRPPGAGMEHTHGGAIMGISPDTSVLNRYLQHWKIPNLWVVGASAFPQADEHETMTLAALSYWAADAFVDRYLKRPGALA